MGTRMCPSPTRIVNINWQLLKNSFSTPNLKKKHLPRSRCKLPSQNYNNDEITLILKLLKSIWCENIPASCDSSCLISYAIVSI